MMDSTKKYKALVSIIIFLLITNFVMLVLFIRMGNPADKRNRGHEREQNGMSATLQKEVGFSKAQLDQYQSSRTELRKNIKPLFEKIRRSKENFYGLLYMDPVSDSLLNNDADSIAQAQKELDLQMFNHFKLIRNICTPAQIPKFDSSIKKVITRMVSRPGRDRTDKK